MSDFSYESKSQLGTLDRQNFSWMLAVPNSAGFWNVVNWLLISSFSRCSASFLGDGSKRSDDDWYNSCLAIPHPWNFQFRVSIMLYLFDFFPVYSLVSRNGYIDNQTWANCFLEDNYIWTIVINLPVDLNWEFPERFQFFVFQHRDMLIPVLWAFKPVLFA